MLFSLLPEDSEKEVKDYVSEFEQPLLLFPVKQIEDLCDIYQVLSLRVAEQIRETEWESSPCSLEML